MQQAWFSNLNPTRQFQKLIKRPTWVGAASISAILIIMSSILQRTASDNVTKSLILKLASRSANSSGYVALSKTTHTDVLSAGFTGLIGATISLFLVSLFYFLIGFTSWPRPVFARALLLAINAFPLVGLTSLLNSVFIVVNGADKATMLTDLFALPALGSLFGHNPIAQVSLSVYNLTNVAYYIDAAIGLHVLLDVRKEVAIAAVVLLSIATGMFYALAAGFLIRISS